jgi:hypothetical protein
MTQNYEEQLAGLFAQAETELPDEHFRAQVMLKVTRQKRKSTILRYGRRVVVLVCLCSIFPVAVRLSLVLGEIIGNSPIMLKNLLQSDLDFPMMLIMLSAPAGYLLIKFRLSRLPSLYLFGRINLFRLYK